MMEIKTDKFEGPLGLLLKLIEKEEMDITEICLAKITDQYINYIRSSENINPDDMADFLVVAAKLLLIKSKALLPYLYTEEEMEIEEFEQQLKMYKEFIEASKAIETMIGKKKFMFAREFNRQAMLANAKIFSPPKKITAGEIKTVFEELIGKIRPAEKLEERSMEKTVSIDDKISAIKNLLIERIKFSFKKILGGTQNKTDMIVSFLAMLELIKQKTITAEQNILFGEIEINKIQH
jgi:segregation and condensation protein A